MRKVTIIRDPNESSAEGTFGQLISDSKFSCFTGELPWRGNEGGKSCIHPGTYQCNWRFSPSHKKNVYHIDDVPGRSDVEIHSGNYCGDKDQGFKSDVLGCVLLGESVEVLDGQKAVTASKKSIKKFEDDMDGQPFMLTIK